MLLDFYGWIPQVEMLVSATFAWFPPAGSCLSYKEKTVSELYEHKVVQKVNVSADL